MATLKTIQSSFASGEISPAMAGRVDMDKYITGAKRVRNMFIHAHGGVSNRPGTYFCGYAAGTGRLIPFQFSVVQTYVLEFTNYKIRIIKDGGLVTYPAGHANAGQIVEITSPYAAADLADLRYVQSADTLFIVHPSYHPKKLTRSSHYDWTFANINYATQQPAPTGVSVSLNGSLSGTSKTIYYKVTAINADTGEESLPSAEVSAAIALPWPSGSYVQISWTAASGANCYSVYKNYRGSYGFIGRTTSTTFTDDFITQDDTITPPVENTPFEASGSYPGAVGIYQQRMIYGRTNNQPQTVFMSKTSLFSNFSSSVPLQDTDSIEATMASRQVNEILHFVPLTVLVCLTTGGEWIIDHGSNSEALTPTSTQFTPNGYRGASNVPPLVIGNAVLFLQRGGKTVRDMYYQLESDSYTGNNLTVLASHLFENYEIIDWCYQQDPDSIIWAIRSDGKLLSFTYLREHQVWAWALHETDGEYESIASIPGTDGVDEVYFIVKRTINNQTVRCIEKLMPRLPYGVLEDAFFVDCGLTYSGDAATVISGLDHLEGCEVSVLADGNVIPSMTVINGSITLSEAASKVHVGLPYKSLLETMDIDLQQVDAAQGQGRKKRIVNVVIRMDKSRGVWVGPDENNLTEMKFRSDEGYNEATALFTGDKALNLAPQWKSDGRIVIQQQYPLPLTVLAVIPEFSIGA